jgi:hypothetical protein
MTYACPLLKKLILHAYSVLQLASGTRVTGGADGPTVLDFPSLFVLARSCVETFLAFDLLYAHFESEEEAEGRFAAWILAGITQRQGFPVDNIDGSPNSVLRAARDREANDVAMFVMRLEQTDWYKNLGSGNRDGGKNWREQLKSGKSWHPEQTLTDRCTLVFGAFGAPTYRFLCSYAHSTALSLIQLETLTPTQRKDAMNLAIFQITKTIALANAAYSGLFSAAMARMQNDSRRALNQDWIERPPGALTPSTEPTS